MSFAEGSKFAERYKTVLVTGASGFIGGHVAEALLESGYRVKAQYLREGKSDLPQHLVALRDRFASGSERRLEFVKADLTDFKAVKRILKGVDYVVHVAGIASDWGPFEKFYRVNFLATWNLIREAYSSSVERFVLISSIAVHGFGNHVDTTEEGPYYRLINPYQITKKMAEDFATAYAKRRNFPLVVIRPGNVYGPRDTTTFYRIFDAMEKGIMGYINGGKSLTCPVYVGDLVSAIMKALERADMAVGEVFDITDGDKVTWRELTEYSAQLLGVRKPFLSAPAPLAYLLALVFEGVFRALRLKSDPPLTIYRVSQLAHNYHFSIKKSEEVLGYKPKINWREGFAKAVEAYKSWKNFQK